MKGGRLVIKLQKTKKQLIKLVNITSRFDVRIRVISNTLSQF